jgi:hypothetical protein
MDAGHRRPTSWQFLGWSAWRSGGAFRALVATLAVAEEGRVGRSPSASYESRATDR